MAFSGAELSGSDPQKLESRADGENDALRPREFFWDSITLYVVSAIIGLAAIDVVTEFIRGSAVACYAPNGEDLSEGQESYINSFCSGSVPMTEYFPAFIVVHGILIAIPHYLWLNHYGGSFDFFFRQSSLLDRLPDEKTGEYSDKNRLIVQQLTLSFSTYKQNWMFILYVLKLILQWVITVAGFGVAVRFFTDFDDTFYCPSDFKVNSTSNDEFWPLPDTRVRCVFTSLRLIEAIHLADVLLLALLIVCFTWSFVWCAATHSTELGCSEVAQFVFQSGMRPEHYVPNYLLWRCSCCKPCRRLFNSIPWFSYRGPFISTNLRFLVMKLFRTDSGLGVVFKDLQVLQEVKSLNDDDQRRVNLHKRQQKAQPMADGGLISSSVIRWDTKWDIIKKAGQQSMFKGTNYDPFHPEEVLTLPDSFRGVIMGLSARAPRNESAIYVNFGTPSLGIPSALARVFDRVGVVNFNPYYQGSDTPLPGHGDTEDREKDTSLPAEEECFPIKTKTYLSNIVEVVCPEDILSSDVQNYDKFLPALKPIWVPEGTSGDNAVKTDFLVIGPIDKPLHNSTVSLFLAHLVPRKIKSGCVLLVIVPTEIAGKDVEYAFEDYIPPGKYFSAFEQRARVISETQEWPPKPPPRPSPHVSASSSSSARTTTTGQPSTQEGESHELLAVVPTSISLPAVDSDSSFQFSVLLGDSYSRIRFKLYQYTPPQRQLRQPAQVQGATPDV